MADIFSKITNFLIPEVEEEEAVVEEKQQNKTRIKSTPISATTVATPELKRAVNDGGVIYNTTETVSSQPKENTTSQPSLRVYKQPNMNILVFEPANFNDTRVAADSLKASKAVLINFEKIEYSEQVRICDFMNGACYVLDGSVKRISTNMVLYVPNGVSIEEIITGTK